MAQVCEVGSLEEFGQLMYGLFLPPLIQNALRELDVSLIISTNDCQIPWELLHDGQTFLGLRAPITRRLMVTRWVAGPESTVTAEPTFLIISNPLGDLPEADKEADELMALLDARGIAYDLLRGPRATYIGVQQALVSGRYEVIHYTGHAFFDAEHPDRSGLHLAGGRNLPASQIEGILRGRPIVFLNACSSARQGEAHAAGWEVGYTGPQAEGIGLGLRLRRSGRFPGRAVADLRRRLARFRHQLLQAHCSTAPAPARPCRRRAASCASTAPAMRPGPRSSSTAILPCALPKRRARCWPAPRSILTAGEWDAALAIVDAGQAAQPIPCRRRPGTRIAAAQAEKARLDALYGDGMALYQRGDWQQGGRGARAGRRRRVGLCRRPAGAG